MRIRGIFVLIALIMIVQGACAWWAAAVRGGIEPIVLSFGTAFAALGLNEQSSHDVQLFDWKGIFKGKDKKKKKEPEPPKSRLTPE